MTRTKKFFAACVIAAALPVASAGAVEIGSVGPVGSIDGCGNCNAVQKTTGTGAPSYVVPFDGILTSFSSRVGSSVVANDFLKYWVVEHIASNSYYVRYDSDWLTIPLGTQNSVVSFKVHVPVKAGQSLGMAADASETSQEYDPVPFDGGNVTGHFSNTSPVLNVNTSFSGTGTGLVNASARIEPDADKDGFGDETEDFCPTNPTRQIECTPPVITDFKSKYAKFKVNSRGVVIAKTTPKGTKLSLTLSEAASVNFALERIAKVKGKTVLKLVDTFSRANVAGNNSFAFSGRYRDAKNRKKKLVTGRYKVTATATDAAGNVGAPVTARFTVVS